MEYLAKNGASNMGRYTICWACGASWVCVLSLVMGKGVFSHVATMAVVTITLEVCVGLARVVCAMIQREPQAHKVGTNVERVFLLIQDY